MLLAAAAAVHDDPSDDPMSSQGNGMGVFAQVRPGTGLVQLGDSQASPRRGRPPISTVLEEAARVAVTCVKLHYDGTPSFHVPVKRDNASSTDRTRTAFCVAAVLTPSSARCFSVLQAW
jgi:hypothetical protein